MRMGGHPAGHLALLHIWAAGLCGSSTWLGLWITWGRGEKGTLLGAVDNFQENPLGKNNNSEKSAPGSNSVMVSKDAGIIQTAKSHLLLGQDSMSESPTCTWYSSPAQPPWFLRTTIAASAGQFSTHYWPSVPQRTSQTVPVTCSKCADGKGAQARPEARRTGWQQQPRGTEKLHPAFMKLLESWKCLS